MVRGEERGGGGGSSAVVTTHILYFCFSLLHVTRQIIWCNVTEWARCQVHAQMLISFISAPQLIFMLIYFWLFGGKLN